MHNTAENFSEEVRSVAVPALRLRGDADMDEGVCFDFFFTGCSIGAGSAFAELLGIELLLLLLLLLLNVSSVCTRDAMVECVSGSFMRSRLCMTPNTASVHPPGIAF